MANSFFGFGSLTTSRDSDRGTGTLGLFSQQHVPAKLTNIPKDWRDPPHQDIGSKDKAVGG